MTIENQIKREIIEDIRNFSQPRHWKYGHNIQYVISNVNKKVSTNPERIKKIINDLMKEKIIYSLNKYGKKYLFLRKEYRYIIF